MVIISILLSLITVFITSCLLIHLYQVYKYSHIPGVSQLLPMTPFRIPYLAPYFFYGNWQISAKLRKRYEKEGMYRVTAFNHTFIILTNMTSVKHVLAKNANNYHKNPVRYRAIDIYGSNIVSASGGEFHRKHRRVVEPAFEEKHLRYLVEVSNQSTNRLIERLLSPMIIAKVTTDIDSTGGSRETNSEQVVTLEVHRDMNDVTMDIIGHSAFGADLNIFNSENPEAKHVVYDREKHKMSFYDALEKTNTVGLAVQNFVPKWLHWLPMFRPVHAAVSETKQYIQELIQLHSDNEDGKYLDLLSLLVAANVDEQQSSETQTTQFKLTNEEIVSDAFIFLFAGFETSASNLGWILYELAKNPQVQQKLIAEIDSVLPNGRSPTYDDIPNLKYLNSCIKETLRLHSPVQAVPKTNKRKDIICGYSIPKQSTLMVHFNSIHHSDKHWPNAMTFQPERFLEEENDKLYSLKFLPFSYGTRRCVGFNFSLIETAVILAKLLQRFTFHFEASIKDPSTFMPDVSRMITVKIKHLNLDARIR